MVRYKNVFILLAVCLSVFFFHLDTYEPDIMEARNFVTAREMVQDGHWLVTTLNGELRVAKPPLPTWMTALAAMAGGMYNLSALRIPAALISTLMVLFCFLLVRDLNPGRGSPLLAGCILATSMLVVIMGRNGSWDIYTHSFMLGALWLLVRTWQRKEGAWKNYLGAGILLGLSFMSKGPVAVYALFLPFIMAYLIVYKGAGIKRYWKPGIIALLLAAMISTAWPLYVSLFSGEELTNTVSTEVNSWSNRHVRPFYFYGHFLLYMGVWLFLCLWSIVVPWLVRKTPLSKEAKLSLIWSGLALLLLSVIPEKKERYLLPAIIPLAITTGYYVKDWMLAFENKRQDRWDKAILWIQGGTLCLAAFSFPVLGYIIGVKAGVIDWWQYGFIGIPLLAMGIWGLGLLIRKKARQLVWFTVAAMCVFMLLIYPFTPEVVYANHDYRGLENIRQESEVANMELYYVGDDCHPSVMWKAGRVVQMWNSGTDHDPLSRLPIAVLAMDPVDNLIPQNRLDKIIIEQVDAYDYSRKNDDHLLYLFLIKARE